MSDEKYPCVWVGGNDCMTCMTCGADYDWRKETQPNCQAANAIERLRSELTIANERVHYVEGTVDLAIRDVIAERRRQIEEEGWTPEHDDEHSRGEMAVAAACYAAPDSISHTDPVGRPLNSDGSRKPFTPREMLRTWSYVRALRWPWEWRWFKRTTRRRDLVKATALLIAEIERLDRAALKEQGHE